MEWMDLCKKKKKEKKSVNGTYGDNWGMLLAKRFFKSFEVELLRPKVCNKPWLMSNLEIREVSRKTESYY